MDIIHKDGSLNCVTCSSVENEALEGRKTSYVLPKLSCLESNFRSFDVTDCLSVHENSKLW